MYKRQDPDKVKEVAEEFHIPQERCFVSAEDLIAQDKLADVMFITTQDQQHVRQAIPALRKGYHLLLEKPISPDLDECRELVKVAKECDRQVIVCHVLRYTPIYSKVKEVIAVSYTHLDVYKRQHQPHGRNDRSIKTSQTV